MCLLQVRDHVYNVLASQAQLRLNPESSLEIMQQKWMSRKISNFEYLTFLNQQAGRYVRSPVIVQHWAAVAVPQHFIKPKTLEMHTYLPLSASCIIEMVDLYLPLDIVLSLFSLPPSISPSRFLCDDHRLGNVLVKRRNGLPKESSCTSAVKGATTYTN